MSINRDLKNKLLWCFAFIFAALSVPWWAEGAILYLLPQSQTVYQDDTFMVEVKLDTEGEEINAVQASLLLPLDLLDFVDFSKGDSILNLWAKDPAVSDNTLYFLGGVPGGFKGEGRIGRVILKGKKEGEGSINFKEDSQVLLNDGMGTPAKLNTGGAIFRVLAEKREVPEDEWQKLLEKDKIPPDPFEIKIGKEATVFEGKYFIAFSTIDKQTGLDHYEVKETRKRRETERETTLNWKKAESPYLLEDQSLKSIIKVKAVDKAGNERIAEYLPAKKPFPYWIIVLILVGIGVIWVILKRIRKR